MSKRILFVVLLLTLLNIVYAELSCGFIVDLSPPFVDSLFPPPDTMMEELSFNIFAGLDDSGAGLWTDSLILTVVVNDTDSTVYNGLNLIPSTFNYGDSVTVCVRAIDEIYDTLWCTCPPNHLDTCWSFAVIGACSTWVDSIWFVEETECNDSNLVDICYHLNSTCDPPWDIEIIMSPDAGATWGVPLNTLYDAATDTGAVSDTGWHCFRWNMRSDFPDYESCDFLVTIDSDTMVSIDTSGGCLDSRPPYVDIECPPDTIRGGESLLLNWLIADLFFIEDSSLVRIIASECGIDTGIWVSDTAILWDVPFLDCPSCSMIVMARDSFCNWGFDTCIFTIEADTYMVEHVCPPDCGIFTSCSNQAITYRIYSSDDPFGTAVFDPTYIQASVTINSGPPVVLIGTDPRLPVYADTVRLDPPPGGYSDGDTVVVILESSVDMSWLQIDTCSFIVDLSPPVVLNYWPSDGELVTFGDPAITINLTDSLSGLNFDSTQVRVIIRHSDSTADTSFHLGEYTIPGVYDPLDTVQVCITRSTDDPLYIPDCTCPPNVMDSTCWEFSVFYCLAGPFAQVVFPDSCGLFTTSCDDQAVEWIVRDTTGLSIDDTTFVVRVQINGPSGPIDTTITNLLWDLDSLLYFDPTVSGITYSSWDTVTVTLLTAYNSGGCPLEAPAGCTFIVDLDPPVVLDWYPPGVDTIWSDSEYFSANVFDSISGMGSCSLRVQLWRASSLVDENWAYCTDSVFLDSMVTNDTVSVCVNMSDAPDFDYCPPNSDSICHFYHIVFGSGPVAHLIHPVDTDDDSIVISACPCDSILIAITDPDGVDTATILLEVEGITYDLTSPELAWDGDSILTFTPSMPCWTHGQWINFELVAADDFFGLNLSSTVSDSFLADYEPPIMITSYPPDGAIIPGPWGDVIWMEMFDSLSGLYRWNDSVVIYNDSVPMVHVPGVVYGDTLFIVPGSDTLSLDGYVEVCLVDFRDFPDYCYNSLDTCFSFTIIVGEPSAVWLYPEDTNGDSRIVTACSTFSAIFGITTSFGLLPDSTLVRIEGIDYSYDPAWMAFSDAHDSLTLDLSTFGFSSGDTVAIELIDIVDSTTGHLVASVSGSFIIDWDGPIYTGAFPTDIVSTSDIDTRINSNDRICGSVVPDSIVAAIGGTPIASAYDTLGVIITGLSDGDIVTVCAYAHDDCHDYCGLNYSDTCWSFSVALGAITANYIYPDDADGDGTIVTACECTEVMWLISSSYSIIAESTEVEIDGMLYDWPSGLLEFRGDTLVWNPDDSICFTDSAVIGAELLDLVDSTGAHLVFTVGDTFLVDISSPVILDRWPYPYAYELTPDFGIVLIDSVYMVDNSRGEFFINGIDMVSGGYTFWHGDTFFANYSSYPDSFDWGDTILVQNRYWDIVDHCWPNEWDPDWFVVIADTVSPEGSLVEPFDGAVSACIDQSVIWFLADTMIGMDTMSIRISVDGSSIDLTDPDLTFAFDTLEYSPSTWTEGNHTVCLDSAIDLFGNPLPSAPICVSFYIDLTPPNITFFEPVCSTVVHDTLQEVIFRVSDSPAGIWRDSTYIDIEGYTFFYSDLAASGDTLILDPAALGLLWSDGDTIEYCVTSCDSADYCTGENCATGCCEFYVQISDYWAEILFPDNGVVSSCSLQSIAWLLHGAVTRDFTITLNDTGVYTSHSAGIRPSGDTIFFEPTASWENGDTIELCLVDAADSFGVHIEDTVCVEFIIDLEPPLFGDFTPPSGTPVSNPSPIVSLTVFDSIAGVDTTSLWFIVDGNPAGSYILGDSLVFDPADSGWSWSAGDTIMVCAGASDLALLCGANSDSICWNFHIAAGGPTIIPIYPPADSLWSACYDQGAMFTLIDSDGIDTSSIAVTAQGDSVNTWVFFDDTLQFEPATPFSDGDTVTVCVYASDILGNPADNWGCITYFIDTMPPVINSITPVPSTTIGDSTPISIVLTDSGSGIDQTSLSLIVDGVEYSPGDSSLFWNGEELSFIPFSSYNAGDTLNVCLDSIIDSPDLCLPNRLDSCWQYIIEQFPNLWTSSAHLDVDPHYILRGESITFEGMGFLSGSDIADSFEVALIVDHSMEIIMTFIHGPASVGDTVIVTEVINDIASFSGISSGINTICLSLDIGGYIEESNETDNIACITFELGESGCYARPNPFSPNSDGVNDEVFFQYPGMGYESALLKIFDMKGRSVIERTMDSPADLLNNFWDGRDSDGQAMPKGVYMYVILRDSEVICHGTVYIAR